MTDRLLYWALAAAFSLFLWALMWRFGWWIAGLYLDGHR